LVLALRIGLRHGHTVLINLTDDHGLGLFPFLKEGFCNATRIFLCLGGIVEEDF
jgi:hypothetical protein